MIREMAAASKFFSDYFQLSIKHIPPIQKCLVRRDASLVNALEQSDLEAETLGMASEADATIIDITQ